jgi:hypothetical protein
MVTQIVAKNVLIPSLNSKSFNGDLLWMSCTEQQALCFNQFIKTNKQNKLRGP